MSDLKPWQFKPGNPGKPKGAIHKTTKIMQARAEKDADKVYDQLMALLGSADEVVSMRAVDTFLKRFVQSADKELEVETTENISRADIESRMKELERQS